MQPAFRSQKQVLLRFMRGEELVSVLEEFCNKQKILGAWVKGLGAVDEVEISYYDLKDRNYKRQGFCGEFELLNLTGNIAPKEGKPFLHAHATFSRPDFSVFGGHLHRMRISGTGEILLQPFEARLERRPDDETGLWLLH